ncbi:MAG: carboxypeptidase-like regulatory domain-containing protein, partial [Planctomycetota bacterium]
PADETLTLARAFLVKGQVIDPGATPVPRASVLCRAEGYRGQGVLTAEDGTFRVTGLREGSVTLIAVPDTWALTAAGGIPVTVSAGSERVTLTLQPDVAMNLRILNWPFEYPAEGTLRIENCPGVRRTQRVRVSAKGTARIEGLRPHLTYSLTFRGPLGDYLPWIQSIPGSRANYSVELTRGLAITGKVVAPEGEWTQYRVYAFGHGMYVNAKADEEGNYTLGGLVPGTWTVMAHAIQKKPFALASGKVTAEAGETADIELTKR